MSLDFSLDRYLERLGLTSLPVGDRRQLTHAGPPSVEGLRILHRAHVERVPYENLDIQLGRSMSISPLAAAARIAAGRGGYCYQLNGAFGLLLSVLGYTVQMHKGGSQWHSDPKPVGATGDHLALTVHGLPSRESPDGMWLVDVGLGDGLYEPLPLRAGRYKDGPFMFELSPSTVEFLGWRFTHDQAGSFVGMDFRADLANESDFTSRHEWFSTDPASPYVRTATVQRRDATGADLLRGLVYRRLPAGTTREVGTAAEWYGLLADVFGLTLADVPADERDALWRRVNIAHEAWRTCGAS